MSAASCNLAPVERYVPPSPARIQALLSLPRAYFRPEFLGLEALDLGKPALWVGNHTLYGLLDVPLMISHLYSRYGVLPRALGDRGHFSVPGWGSMLARGGMVLGTPENCAALMRSGAHVLVFPGGGREVMRRKGEAYQLIWKRRTGFARMAMEHGYDIIPFGSLGPEESFDILLDANDVMASRLWRWLKERLPLERLTRDGDMIPPLARGLGPTLLPRPQRFYFGFGERISTLELQGSAADPNALWALREQVAVAIEAELARLREYRSMDKPASWSRLRRWLTTTQEAKT